MMNAEFTASSRVKGWGLVYLLLLVRGANGTLHGPYRDNEERGAAARALLDGASPDCDVIPLDVGTNDYDTEAQLGELPALDDAAV